jgi:hypothetical protein
MEAAILDIVRNEADQRRFLGAKIAAMPGAGKIGVRGRLHRAVPAPNRLRHRFLRQRDCHAAAQRRFAQFRAIISDGDKDRVRVTPD